MPNYLDSDISNGTGEKPEISNSENNDQENNTTMLIQKPQTKHIKWSPENELIMVEWCDIAQCYKWLHTRCHKKLAALHAWFTIPAIALSTISGTASFAQTSLPLDAQVYAPMAIGTINILIGISTTIQQYLKISELNELHRVSGLLWDKFSRNIRIELAKDPDERMDAGHFLKICRQEFDRLMETSPSIDQSVITEFNQTFRGRETEEQKEEFMKLQQRRFEELRKPDICDIIISSNESRHKWYKDPERLRRMNSEQNNSIELNANPDIPDVENPDPSGKEPENIVISSISDPLTQMLSASGFKGIKIQNGRGDAEEGGGRDVVPPNEYEKDRKKQDRMSKFRQGTLALAAKIKSQNAMIDKYIRTFEDSMGRKPNANEIELNMRDKIDADILAKYVREMPDAPPEVPPEVPADVPAEVPAEVPLEVPTDVPPEVPTEVPAEVPAEVPLEVLVSVPPVLDVSGGEQFISAAETTETENDFVRTHQPVDV
jgi:hypothetical protein